MPAEFDSFTSGNVETRRRRLLTEPPVVRTTLLTLGIGFLVLFIGLPLVTVFTEALRKGWDAYLSALHEPAAFAAIASTVRSVGSSYDSSVFLPSHCTHTARTQQTHK